MSNLFRYPMRQLFSIIAIGLIGAINAQANAATLQITSGQSQVTYTPGTGFPGCSFDGSGNITCAEAPMPQTASLSGQIDLNVVHEHFEIRGNVVDRDLIYLTTKNFSAGPLSSVFPLAGAVGLISGNTFQVSDNPCFLSPEPQCSYSGYSTSSWGANGTWDGSSLVWSGWSSERFGDSLSYTINAQVSAVPEPHAALLFSLGLLTVIVRKRQKSHA